MQGSPLRIGVLYDFPLADGGAATEAALRMGLDEVRADGRLDREVELVTEQVAGLPMGSEHDVVRGFRALDEAGCLLVVGPAISDNALITTPIGDEIGLVTINYTGGERTRGAFGFHYQVGSLEEEPAALAQRLQQRGLSRPAVVHDRSPVGTRYAECFDDATAALGLEITGRHAVSPLTDDVTSPLARLRDGGPDSLVYLGLGVASRAVALGLESIGWAIPVIANSALMFGYARPEWRDGWAGWEYLDAIADDNERRQAIAAQAEALAGSPVTCAMVDMGRLVGEAIARADHLTRDGLRVSLERIKRLPSACGYQGTTMGFGVYDHGALSHGFLVLREWKDGKSVQVAM
jgi:ABC-type branched-subunit amino acid transport system substrate-binding protein